MKFIYGKQDLRSLGRAQENCFLLTNGLGGYASLSAAFSVTRCDQGVLIGAKTAPNVRVSLVHRLSETLCVGERQAFLSSQGFAGRKAPEDGWKQLSSFTVDHGMPVWTYHVRGVQVTRRMAMTHEKNAVAVLYTIDNRTDEDAALSVTPFMLMTPKGQARRRCAHLSFDGRSVSAGALRVFIRTDGGLSGTDTVWQRLSYPDDAKDGRQPSGLCGSCCTISVCAAAGERTEMTCVFSMEDEDFDARDMLASQERRMRALKEGCGLSDPTAIQLALAADAYLSRKESTGGMTLLAGYPLFGDWGRDTMIALPGCALSAGRCEEAKSILRTFLAYERGGLVPNLFPEGGQAPMYNTADAALLLINAVHLYLDKTNDSAFLHEAWPVMKRIVDAYQSGTEHGIRMDDDALIMAGGGMDQVTWMDVRIGDILPTPRHGKPVEINAYWYSALRIMQEYAPCMGESTEGYMQLAARVKDSFVSQFYVEDKGCLRDVLCGGAKAEMQIRPNQIWAVTQPFTMLSAEQEKRVVDCVYAQLYTPCGLRTLCMDDPEYRGAYGGDQLSRDLAYHQGTAWVFPLGAFYLAYLKTRGYSREAARQVRGMLEPVEAMLREGCAGQLPEIYEGDCPGESKGCFAQAWSVGELLCVYEKLEEIERLNGSAAQE